MKNIKNKKVLIIDDDKYIGFILEEIVKIVGGKALKAERADKGLSLFLRESPKIVFCDINLPGESGITLIKKMRTKSSSLKIMAMSVNDNYKKEAMDAGADFFLKKPFRIKDIKKFLVS